MEMEMRVDLLHALPLREVGKWSIDTSVAPTKVSAPSVDQDQDRD